MATEASWVRKLNKQSPLKNIYSFGSTGTYTSGVPDRYYEGTKKMLWVEFKHIQKETHMFNAQKSITPLQRHWLIRNWKAGHAPHVIVGVGTKWGFILDRPIDWETYWTPEHYQQKILSVFEIAQYLEKFLNGTR